MANPIKTIVKDFFAEWNQPKEGNQVSNKEMVAFSGGGIGIKTINGMITYIQLTATCLLMGTVYGLSPRNLLILFVISNIVSVVKTPLVSWIVDNTNTKIGKFRPYLLWAGIPCLIGVFGICFLVPVNGTTLQKMIAIGVFFNIYSISQQLYNNAYMGLSQVISTSTGERNKIMSISEFISNLGPSIVQLILPLFAGWFFGKEEGLLDIRAYRILLPAFSCIGFALGLIVMAFTKERVILVKSHVQKVKFTDGLRLVGGNREFWIVTLSKFFGGFRAGIGMLLAWLCIYQLRNSFLNGILPTFTSLAFIPGMLLAPLLMKKLGSGKAAFVSFMANCVAAIIMLLTFRRGYVFFIIALFLFNFASGPQYIMQTSITADALDEIQLKSGERVEGFAQNFHLMFEVIGNIGAQFAFMFIYEANGLVAGEDGNTDYSILYDDSIRNNIFRFVIIVGIIASLLSAVPFLFTKLTRKRHEEIIEELKAIKAKEESEATETGIEPATEADLNF